MHHLTLRQATPEDSEFAYAVRKAAFGEHLEKSEGGEEGKERSLHEQRFRTQAFQILQVAGQDVGMVALDVAPDCLKVNQLLILPRHQRQGIGSACMALLLEEARRFGRPIRLRVRKTNPRTLAFSLRLGFRRTGETQTHNLLENAPL